MAPNQRCWNRKRNFSDTFELSRDAYCEIVEQYVPWSSESTSFSSSQDQVRRQPFCHCTEAPSSDSGVSSVYRLGLLWQPSRTGTCWRQFASRLLCWRFWQNDHLQVTGHSPDSGQCFSRNPPIAFERTQESSSFNSQIFISVLSGPEFVAGIGPVICTERFCLDRHSQCVVADKQQRR